MSARKQTVSVDFDGVIHAYSRGWADGTIYDGPVDGAFGALKALMSEYCVFIMSTRSSAQIIKWMAMHAPDIRCEHVAGESIFWNREGVIGVTNRKLAAIAYIDDRGIRFTSWLSTLDTLANLT